MRATAFVFARGGSVGLPGKNLRLLGGKPLIAHAIEVGRDSPRISEVIVSTDDPEIARVARLHGAQVPWLRPSDLASNTAREWDAWRHAIRSTYRPDKIADSEVFVSLPATAPLRTAEDVEACLDRYLEGDVDVVVSVRESDRNPYYNMVTVDADGRARLVVSRDGPIDRRQDAPAVFDLTTVAYVASPSFVLCNDGLFEGRVGVVEIPKERAVDIDDEIDFAVAEMLYERRKA
jgi:CMP-N-acetylneuraminic acid synthetase